MHPKDPHDRPFRVLTIDDEIVFLGEGPISFSMTPAAARLTLDRLAAVLDELASPGPAAIPASAKAPVVLLVEDEPLVREIGVIVLEDAGYLVIEAASASQALSTLEAGTQIDLIFTDIQMPGALDGLQLAQLVSERWPAIHLLISSGQVTPPYEAMPAGGRFLSKPYIPSDMLRHVGEMIAA